MSEKPLRKTEHMSHMDPNLQSIFRIGLAKRNYCGMKKLQNGRNPLTYIFYLSQASKIFNKDRAVFKSKLGE